MCVRLVLAAALAALCAGCASPYWQNRRADAADIFTATVGIGLGATARIGPLHAGLGANADLYGIEAGEVGSLGSPAGAIVGAGDRASDACYLFAAASEIDLGSRSAARGKNVAYRPSGIPFWNPPWSESPNPARWTQIEVAAGLLVGFRLGFNPGELLDFVLGFFGVDIYDDDIARGEGKEPHAESAEGAEFESHAESAETAEAVSVVSVDSVVMSTGRDTGKDSPSTGPSTESTDTTDSTESANL